MAIITIVAHDLSDEQCPVALVLQVEVPSRSFDIHSAVSAAVAEYLETPDGAEYSEGSFNWGDVADYLPEEICNKHGFRIKDVRTADVVVEHDESFPSEE